MPDIEPDLQSAVDALADAYAERREVDRMPVIGRSYHDRRLRLRMRDPRFAVRYIIERWKLRRAR